MRCKEEAPRGEGNRTPQPDLRVLVYRDEILPLSQTFVRAQVDRMPYSTLLVGVRRVRGQEVSTTTWTIEDGKSFIQRRFLWRTVGLVFKLTGRSRSLDRVMRTHGPDVVVAHFAQDGFRISNACRRLGVPLVVVVHGSDVLARDSYAEKGRLGDRKLARNWPTFLREVSLFLPVSDFVADALMARGATPKQVKRHYIGVPIPPIDLESTWEDRLSSKEILFVGRLVANKGAADLLAALSTMTGEWHATIVGGGPQESSLRQLARDLGLESRVRFTGPLAHAEVLSLLARARVMCAPSVPNDRGESEGLNMAVLEAQALGLPVVAYATGGLVEALRSGETGITVSTGDCKALAEALTEVMDNDELCMALARRGREWVEGSFDIDVQTAELMRMLKEVVSQRKDA